jgi:hypothetical protein
MCWLDANQGITLSEASIDDDLTEWGVGNASASDEDGYYLFTESDDESNLAHRLTTPAINASVDHPIVFGCDFKAVDDGRNITLYYAGSVAFYVVADTSSGEVLLDGNLDEDDYDVTTLEDGWYRIAVTMPADANITGANAFRIYSAEGTATTYQGDGKDCFYVKNVSLTQTRVSAWASQAEYHRPWEASIDDDLSTWSVVRATATYDDDDGYYIFEESSDASATDHRISEYATVAAIPDQAVTMTCEAKALSEDRSIRLHAVMTEPSYVSVNLQDGSVLNTLGTVDAVSVTALDDDWYRISVTFSADSSLPTLIYRFLSTDAAGDAVYQGDGREAILIRNTEISQPDPVMAHSVAQATAANQPLYIDGAKPYIRFDETDDRLVSTLTGEDWAFMSDGSGGEAWAIFAAHTVPPATISALFGTTNASAALKGCMYRLQTGGNVLWQINNATGTSLSLLNLGALVQDQVYVSSVAYDEDSAAGSELEATIYSAEDGLVEVSAAPNGSPESTVTGTMTIGSGISSNAGPFDVRELIFFNRKLTDNERTNMRQYLKAKWGVA